MEVIESCRICVENAKANDLENRLNNRIGSPKSDPADTSRSKSYSQPGVLDFIAHH